MNIQQPTLNIQRGKNQVAKQPRANKGNDNKYPISNSQQGIPIINYE